MLFRTGFKLNSNRFRAFRIPFAEPRADILRTQHGQRLAHRLHVLPHLSGTQISGHAVANAFEQLGSRAIASDLTFSQTDECGIAFGKMFRERRGVGKLMCVDQTFAGERCERSGQIALHFLV